MKIGDDVYYWEASEGLRHCDVSIKKGNVLSFDENSVMVITTKFFFLQRIESYPIKNLFSNPYEVMEELITRLKKGSIRNFNIGFRK
jgi:hypothetical protein